MNHDIVNPEKVDPETLALIERLFDRVHRRLFSEGLIPSVFKWCEISDTDEGKRSKLLWVIVTAEMQDEFGTRQ